jgi:hypothetical protein
VIQIISKILTKNANNAIHNALIAPILENVKNAQSISQKKVAVKKD